jgi:hypothetical protein
MIDDSNVKARRSSLHRPPKRATPASASHRGRPVERRETRSSQAAAKKLAECFRRNGYLRRQNKQRVKKEGHWEYKKGDELRFTANSKDELALIRRLLQQLRFQPGRPFVKDKQFRQPIYGRGAITELLRLMRVKE